MSPARKEEFRDIKMLLYRVIVLFFKVSIYMNLLKEQNKNMLYPNYTARLANLTFKYVTRRRKSFESIRLFLLR